jgi:UDP-N-acetylmuramoyl-tripeptide--D-alanyl-D-alanine ligase
VPRLTFAQLAQMAGGEVLQGAEAVADSVVIDSREVKPGAVFFAIRGERLDGHTFLEHALRTGAGAVVDHPVGAPSGKGLVLVADTTVALQAFASAVRRAFPFLLIGVTGSAGKTTTKEMIGTLLETERPTWRSWGNFNNQIGFPLCLSNTPDSAQVVISEMGMNHAGELAMLTRLAPPDIGVYTNIGPVHLEFFDSIDGIAAAKRELLENMKQDGTVVINADDFRVVRISEGFPGRRVLYGVAGNAEYRASSIEERGLLGSRITLRAEGSEYRFELALPGRHNAQNLLAAIATARVAGISWEGITEGVRKIRAAYHRGEIVPWRGAILYDDTYNSNPYALEKALELLSKAESEGRRIAVIGDMLELGGDEIKFHREVGRAIPRNIDAVVAVGNRSGAVLQGAREAGFRPDVLHHFGDAPETAEFLRDFVQEGDVVLLKASRGIGLDRVIALLREAS